MIFGTQINADIQKLMNADKVAVLTHTDLRLSSSLSAFICG